MNVIPTVILCGGQGTRMRGQTLTKKELVHVGGRPIIWHVMRIYSAYGFNRFILTLGHEADQIKQYFLNYETLGRDLTLHLGDGLDHGQPVFHSDVDHPTWKVSLVDTGLFTEKASRIVRVRDFLKGPRFFVAYGDDVSDVNLESLLAFHRNHGKLATITAVQISLPYGVVHAEENGMVTGFIERPQLPDWINGGFMIFEHQALDYMAGGQNVDLETEVLPRLAGDKQLMIYRHDGFWQSMNTMKDNMMLEKMWRQGAPWKVW